MSTALEVNVHGNIYLFNAFLSYEWVTLDASFILVCLQPPFLRWTLDIFHICKKRDPKEAVEVHSRSPRYRHACCPFSINKTSGLLTSYSLRLSLSLEEMPLNELAYPARPIKTFSKQPTNALLVPFLWFLLISLPSLSVCL